MAGNELVTRQHVGTLAKTSTAHLPAPISNGIFDLLTAFAAGPQQEDADKKRLVRIYSESVAVFPPAVSEYALRWLKLHNPRNPFRPTPQDVYEACEGAQRYWRDRVVAHFTSPEPAHARWPWQDYSGIIKGCGGEWGPAPFAEGCLIPETLVKQFLKDHLDRGHELNSRLASLGRARLSKIPEECFVRDQQQAILDLVEADEKRREATARHEAYLTTLDPDLRHWRRIALAQADGSKITEQELIERAQTLQAKATEDAKCHAAEAKANRERAIAHNHPDIQAAIAKMQEATGEDWDKAVDDYIGLLAREGATPPPHLVDPVLRRSTRNWRRHAGRLQ